MYSLTFTILRAESLIENRECKFENLRESRVKMNRLKVREKKERIF